jgi:8-oxo-dGTP pyrophosphatase MutT (NUDIX family)
MANEKLFYIGIKGLIINETGKVLLLKADVSKHRKNVEPYWDIPGGRISDGQTVIETLQREIEEETGITELESYEFFTAVVSKHEVPLNDMLLGLALMVYRVKIPRGSKIIISEEHTAYEWASKAKARQYLSHKYPSEFIDKL